MSAIHEQAMAELTSIVHAIDVERIMRGLRISLAQQRHRLGTPGRVYCQHCPPATERRACIVLYGESLCDDCARVELADRG